jgi:hypothetical protein
MYQTLFWKLGETFGTTSFHLSNFERISNPKVGRPTFLNPGSALHKTNSAHSEGQNKSPVYRNPTPSFVYAKIQHQENLGDFCVT